MVTVRQAQQQISEQRQAFAQAQQQAGAIQTRIPVTRTQLQRATPISQVRLKETQRLRALEKARIVKGIGQQEREFEEAVAPIETQIQQIKTNPWYYVQQTGMKGTPVYGKVAKGYAPEVMGYKYETPYGTVTDWSPRGKAYGREYRYEGGQPKQDIIFPWQVDPSEFKPEIPITRTFKDLETTWKTTQIPQQRVPGPITQVQQRAELSYGALRDLQQRAAGGDAVAQRIMAEGSFKARIPHMTVRKVPQQQTTFQRIKSLFQKQEQPRESAYSYTLGRVPTAEERATMIVPGTVAPEKQGFVRGIWEGPDMPIVGTYPGIKKVIEFPFKKISEFAKLYEEKKRREGSIFERRAPDWMKRIQTKPFGEQSPESEMTKAIREGLKPGSTVKGWEWLMEKAGVTKPYEEWEPESEKIRKIKEWTEKSSPRWAVNIVDALVKFELFAPYMQTATAKKGKQKTKQKTKQELMKRSSKKIKEKVEFDLNEIMKTSSRENVNKDLVSYMNKYKNVARASGETDEMIVHNIKGMMEYAQSRGHLVIRTEDIIPGGRFGEMATPEGKIEGLGVFEGPFGEVAPPVLERVAEVETAAYAAEQFLKPEERVISPSEGFVEEPKPSKDIFKSESELGKIEKEVTDRRTIVATTAATIATTGLLTAQEAEQKLKEEQKQEQAQISKQTQWLGTSTLLKTKQRQRQIQRQIYKPSTTISPKPPKKPPVIVPFFFPEDIKRRRKKLKRKFRFDPLSFRVQVRKRGKFYPVVPFPVVKGEALFLGRRAVKRGAAATFKLIPTKAKPKKAGVPKITEAALIPEFRKPKKGGEPLTFIQKRAYRIKTPGERKEITMKGWAARRKRKVKWL